MDATGTARVGNVRAGLLTAHLTRGGGGVFTSVKELAHALRAEPGLEVEVFGPARAGSHWPEWGSHAPKTAAPIGPRFFCYAPKLAEMLAKADLDLVHLHGLWMHPSMAAKDFTKRTGRPRVVSPHGMLDPWALRNSGWKKQLAAAAFEEANIKTAACLHALNQAEEEAIRDYGYAGPVCVIPNGVELPAAGMMTPEPPWWSKSAPGIKTLLYLGRLHPKKGLMNLLLAWSRLKPEKRAGWRLVIAGWDERGHQSDLQRTSGALRLEATVNFPGALFGAEKAAAFYHCEGFILPSVSEGLPMVLLEAWAYGKPVLMTPQCNLPEGFDAKAALRIEPEEGSVGDGLKAFMEMEDSARTDMGSRGRALVEERFSWPVVAEKMAGVYRWLTRNGRKPECVQQP